MLVSGAVGIWKVEWVGLKILLAARSKFRGTVGEGDGDDAKLDVECFGIVGGGQIFEFGDPEPIVAGRGLCAGSDSCFVDRAEGHEWLVLSRRGAGRDGEDQPSW